MISPRDKTDPGSWTGYLVTWRQTITTVTIMVNSESICFAVKQFMAVAVRCLTIILLVVLYGRETWSLTLREELD